MRGSFSSSALCLRGGNTATTNPGVETANDYVDESFIGGDLDREGG